MANLVIIPIIQFIEGVWDYYRRRKERQITSWLNEEVKHAVRENKVLCKRLLYRNWHGHVKLSDNKKN